jgi:hypothetical protein
MRAYLIDPSARMVSAIDLDEKRFLDHVREIIGWKGLDYGLLSDMKDTIWVYEFGLVDEKPIAGFKLLGQLYAGRAVITGVDDFGENAPPYVPLEMIRRDIEWLGVIVPKVIWGETERGLRATVTYESAPGESL